MLIIDGHNLIPHIEGLALDDLDDERRLLELLQQYARLKRKQVLVFFDKAAPGRAGEQSFGTVRARFVPAGSTADDAIAQTLRGMAKGARQQARVVSSDGMVREEARSRGVGVIDSPTFARELRDTLARPRPSAQEPAASSGLEEWYDLFKLDPSQAERPIEPEKSRPRRKGSQSPPAGQPQPPRPGQAQPPSQPAPRRRRFHGFDKKPG